MSYCLGEFAVAPAPPRPPFGGSWEGESGTNELRRDAADLLPDWILRIVYTPQPPRAVAYGQKDMNPWETERKREQYQLEEQIWSKIKAEQAKYRPLRAYFEEHYIYLVRNMSDAENMAGKKQGSLIDPKDLVVGIVSNAAGGWYGAAFKMAMLGIDVALAASKQKKIKGKIRDAEMEAERLSQTMQKIQPIVETVQQLLNEAAALPAVLAQRDQLVVQFQEQAYTTRQQAEREQAAAHRAKVMQTAGRQERRPDNAI